MPFHGGRGGKKPWGKNPNLRKTNALEKKEERKKEIGGGFGGKMGKVIKKRGQHER